MCDNKLVIVLVKNFVIYGRSKYIDIKYRYISEFVKNFENKVVNYCKRCGKYIDIKYYYI